jgi:hypothetical protein
MSFFNSGQPIIVPDPADPTFGPSATNVPIPSSTPGTPVTENVNSGQAVIFYNVAASLFPQTASTNYTYRFTFNGQFTAGTTAGSGGNVSITVSIVQTDTTEYIIGGSTYYASSSLASGSLVTGYYSISAVFIPNPGDRIVIRVVNFTNGNITGATLRPQAKGCGIELVSKQSAPQLIFS